MTTYQGPHAAVTQRFVTGPGAIAIEDLPSVVVATAFDVYVKELLGSSYGIIDRELAWGSDNVVFDKDAINQSAYDFYPATIFGTSPFGEIELEMGSGDLTATGATIGKDDAYKVPNTEKVAGSSEGIMPYYKRILTAGDVQIYANALDTVVIVGGTVVTARLKPGQKVFVTDDGGTSWIQVGVVGSIGNDETKIKLAVPYTAAITIGDGIAVGSASDTLIDIPDTIYDPQADFITSKVKVGDVVYLSSLSIAGSVTTPKAGSIVSVIDKNTLKINTETLTTGEIDYNFLKYKPYTETPGSTVLLYTYWVERYLGFSQNYGIKKLNAAVGVTVTKISSSVLTVPIASFPIMNEGDVFIITTANIGAGTDERDTTYFRPYRIATIVLVGSTYEITIDGIIYQSGVASEVEFITGNFIHAWTPKIETSIKGDFRAIRDEEQQVVKRIASIQDIVDAWSKDDTISVYNELAFMASIVFSISGGKVMYGGNVDAAATNLAAEYTNMLEEFKLKDVYSHAFGTTDAGVNALAGPYCDGQADPYEGHERIAVLTYDEEDIYLMGTDTGEVAITGIITIDGAFDPIAAGLTVKDQVKIFDSSGNFIETVSVVATPDVGSPTLIETDYDGSALGAGHSFKFLSGRKDDQAIRIGNIKYGNRRVSVIWPGWFRANVGNETFELPPYYISAAVAGLDSGIIVSQSQTNMPFSIPGLSNIQLNTSTYFRKAQLDEIGGGGIDVFIQESTVTQSIKSRHDLTSNMDAVEFRERSITKQSDVAAKTIRNSVKPYVGRYNITPDLFTFLGEVSGVATTKLIKKGILYDIRLISIDRDEIIADKINFVFEATVFVAGNYYDITLIIKSS